MAISTFDELKTAVANWLESNQLTSRVPEFIALGEARLRREIRMREMLKRTPLLSGTPVTITAVTKADPAVVTAADHGLTNGQTVYIQGIVGMVEINRRSFTVANKTDNTIELSGENSTGHTAWSSGGQVILEEVDSRYATIPDDFLAPKTLRLSTSPRTVLTFLDQHSLDLESLDSTGKPKFFTIHEEFEFDRSTDQNYTGELIYYREFEPLSDGNTSNLLLDKAPDAYLYAALLGSAPFLMHDERIPIWNALYESARDGLNKTAIKSQSSGPRVARVVGRGP